MEWLTEGWGWLFLLLGALVSVAIFYAARYEKVGPNEVLIVSGRKGVFESPTSMERSVRNFRIYHGGGTFVMPVREKTDRMSVELMTLEIHTPEFYTKLGVPIVVDAIAQIKVRSDDPIATATAAEMFLSKGRAEMNEIAHQMMQGHLRAVISTLPIEEIHRNPEAFAQSVHRLTSEDLANMGIQVVSFTIREIQDPNGYLNALGRPELAGVHKDAALGEATAQRDSQQGKAQAERDAAVVAAKANEEARLAQLSADVAIADAQRDRDVNVHEYNRQVSEAEAKRDMAYELQKAKTEQALVNEKIGVSMVEREKQIEVEELEITRREKELDHTVRKPAEADRFKTETLASGEQRKVQMLAEAQAEAAKLQGLAEAEVIKAKGEAEAEVIRQKALAEAEGVEAMKSAEAEGMRRKAEAWKEYTAPAISELLIDRLPDIASAVAGPLEKIDRIVMVNNGDSDSTGVERVTKGVTNVMAQVPGFVELMQSVDLKGVVQQIPGLVGAPTSGNGQEETPPEPPMDIVEPDA
ncbi:MAG TPA: SPFH domain-containing protein [Armatimonadota bacterium]|nr:SPFH domain-containing protein [Armatimonadota bacterium]